MYDFHYNFIKKILMLIYCLLIQRVLFMKSNQNMFMKNFLNTKHLFDFSKYQSNIFYPTNKKVIGKMKDEFTGIPTNKFTGLKSKMYRVISDDEKK